MRSRKTNTNTHYSECCSPKGANAFPSNNRQATNNCTHVFQKIRPTFAHGYVRQANLCTSGKHTHTLVYTIQCIINKLTTTINTSKISPSYYDDNLENRRHALNMHDFVRSLSLLWAGFFSYSVRPESYSWYRSICVFSPHADDMQTYIVFLCSFSFQLLYI